MVGLGGSCALVARQHFKDTLGLSPTTAMPLRPGSPFPAEPLFITKVLPLCPAAPKTQIEVRGEFGGAGREGGGRGGEGALCWVALGWERRAPSTVHPNAGQGKVSAHGCGHQILVSGHVGAAVRGWNKRPVQMYRGKIPSGRSRWPGWSRRAGRAGCLVPPWCCWHHPGGWGGHPSDLCTRAVVVLARRVALKQLVPGWKGVFYVRLVKISA